MSAITLIVVIAVLWAVRNFIVGFYAWLSRQNYKYEYRTERTQSHFAAARNDLMLLAIANEVDVNSVSFKQIYALNTALMRRPDQYPEFSQAIAHWVICNRDEQHDEVLERESKEWSPAFRQVVKATAHAMDYIILDYSWIMRLMFRIEKRLHPDTTPKRMLSRISQVVEEKERSIAEIRRTQKAMYRMASATT
jgi:hypothetical protein